MKLLPNEEVKVTSDGKHIVLSDTRIELHTKRWGRAYSIAIFLENISSIETKYSSWIIFIILAVLTVLAGLYSTLQHNSYSYGQQSNNSLIYSLILALIFIGLWWFSRKHIISISSNGGASMNFEVGHMKEEKVQEFIYNVSLAKDNRVKLLRTAS